MSVAATQPLSVCLFPVAGLGTKFLPLTKNTPKEMLPLLDRPIIHYGVEEAVSSGCSKIVFIARVGKGSIRDYFSPNPELVKLLRDEGRNECADIIEGISKLANFQYVGQPSPDGLGDAIRCAASKCANVKYIGIILPDDVMRGNIPALAQLEAVRQKRGGSVIALERVSDAESHRYGMAETEEVEPGLHRIKSLVEKPVPGSVKSNLAVIGRYILSTKIFEQIEKLKPDGKGLYQLTDAIMAMIDEEPLWGVECDSERLDCGTIAGWLAATARMAREVPEYSNIF